MSTPGPRHARASAAPPRRAPLGLLVTITVGLVVAIALVVMVAGGSTKKSPASASAPTSTTASTASTPASGAPSSPKAAVASATASTKSPKGAIAAIEAGVLPWTLSSPLSREVVLPGSANTLTVAGGLLSSQASSSQLFSLNTTNGTTSNLGTLATGVHDASGAYVDGRGYLFGGGSPNTVDTVQQFPAPPPAGSKHAAASVTPQNVGKLPQPRSDSSATTIGSTTYIVGGYDGTNADADVLATTDGRRFSTVAKLPVPVRYAAVAALGAKVYVFGGQAIGGSDSGKAVTAIQVVNPAQQTASVIGHLPHPLAGASAAVLSGHLYIAGGVSDTSSGAALTSVYAFNRSTNKVLNAGTLPVPTSYAGTAVLGGRAWMVGGENNGTPVNTVEMMVPNKGFGTAGAVGAGSPFYGGRLLIADRGNNRLLLLNTQNKIVWRYPSASAPAPPGGFYFPDDAFFAKHGTEIISNEEKNEVIVILGFPSGKVLWSYGHPGQIGTAPGYLYEPDDAYLLKSGQISVADADNCRILVINPNHTIANQIGSTRSCVHNPPTSLGSPNGDTPLKNGNFLISEIMGSWVSEYTPQGKLVWTVQLPIAYPSDPQQIGPNLYLVSNYATPGGFIEFTRQGKVVYSYAPSSGPGMMNQDSLTEKLPSGVFMTNDDYRDRMVAIDPATKALVWQYGVTDTPGTAPGYLNTPDGFDLLMHNGTTPTHPYTG